MDRKRRPALDDGGKRRTVRVIEPGRLARRHAVDETVRLERIGKRSSRRFGTATLWNWAGSAEARPNALQAHNAIGRVGWLGEARRFIRDDLIAPTAPLRSAPRGRSRAEKRGLQN